MTIYLSLFVALVGLVMYLLPQTTNGKITEIGRIFLWTGLLAFLLQSAPHMISTVR